MSNPPPAASREATADPHAPTRADATSSADASDASDASDAAVTSDTSEAGAITSEVGAVTSEVGATRDAAASERVILEDQAIRRALMRMAHEVVESADGIDRLFLVAIPNGGVPLARILADNLESLTDVRVPLGILDTTLYRDDLSTRGARPKLRRTEMPSSVDDRVVVLVEDVVNTGRTIRAAMDALMDFGRPSHVRVVALVDRGHRELPIKIDYVGKNIPTQPTDKVVFRAEELPEGDDGVAPVGELTIAVRVPTEAGRAGGEA